MNKNRLLGGAVIALSAFLFVPALLTPPQKKLANPQLSVNLQTEGSQTVEIAHTQPPVKQPAQPQKPQAQPSIAVQPAISLESLASNTAPKTQPALRPVSLESSRTPKAVQKASWLRVGSFSNKDNAKSLWNKLQANYPTKMESTTVKGKTYHRVLVGPFYDPGKLAMFKKSLTTKGYNFSEQH